MASAPARLSPPPPSPPPPPPPVTAPGIITLNNQVKDGQIVSTLYLMAVIGVICFVIFIIFRKGIKLYQTRLYLANVTFKPPEMVLTGHRRIWSWLVPIFTVKDEEIIRSCGLDSLMIVKVAALGVQLFFPITILACLVLLPTYMSQNYLAEQHAAGDVASTSTPFSRATMGNIKRASPVFWVPFVYVYIVVIYASWLLRYHYKEYGRLRHRYIVQGEVSVNEWHDHFLAHGARRTSLMSNKPLPPPPSSQQTSIQSIVQHWTGLAQRRNQSDNGTNDGELDGRRESDLSVEDGEHSELRQRNLRRNSSSTSQGSSPLLRKLASRRAARAGSASVGGASPTPSYTTGAADSPAPPPLPPLSPPAATANGQPGLLHTPAGPSARGLPQAPGSTVGTPAAGAATPAAGVPTQAATGQDAVPVDGSLQDGAQRRETASQTGDSPPARNYLEQVFRRAESDLRRSRPAGQGIDRNTSGKSDTVVASPDTAPSLARMDNSEAAASEVGSILQQQWAGSSRYATGEAQDTPSSGVVVYKWWQGHRDPHGHLLSGKPNVWARKVVNTTNAEGRAVGVMAQQFVVLVEGVPDPATTQQQGWRHTEVGRIVWKALRQKRKGTASSSGKGQPDQPDKPVKGGPPRQPADMPSSTGKAHPASSNNGSHHIAIDVDKVNGKDGEHGGSDSTSSRPSNVVSNGRADEQLEQLVATGMTAAATARAEGAERVTDDGGHPVLTREEVVQEFFSYMFPDTFQLALPVLRHKEVDLLLIKWDAAAKALEIAEAAYEASELTTRPTALIGGCCCFGRTKVDAINHWAKEVRELEAAIGEARQRALRSEPTGSFFVFFNDQRSAATAAQVSLQSEDGRQFRVTQAPGPEEVNWPTLWEGFRGRNIRSLLVAIPIGIMIIFPIGIFAGSVSQLTLLLCGSPQSTVATGVKWPWFCSSNNYIRKLITGVVPPLILTLWQGIVVPQWFYYWCQAERRAASFTQLDQRILSIFYWWSVISVFIGAMLGGSIFSQFRVALEDPGQIASIIGTALPTSSNFFINYAIVQALAIVPFRFMFPHMGVFPWMFRACGFCKPPTKRVEYDRLWPHSARGAKEIAFIILVYVIGLAYAAASPLILPVVLLYSVLAWMFWRYAVLYFFERCYESGGRLFERIFSQMVFTLFIFEAFTAAVFFANSAWAQGSIILLTLTLYLYQFHKHCTLQFGHTKHVPLESATGAPRASVDPAIYIPPALRHGCAGWYPESGKAWEAWNAKVYTI